MFDKSISLVMPVCNEESILEKNIGILLDYVEKLSNNYEVVFVENGSSDSTLEVLKNISKKNPKIRFFTTPERDLGIALDKGFREAKNEILIWYPIDLSFDFSFFDESLRLIEGYDLVVGSKEMDGATQVRPPIRLFLSKCYHLLIRALFRLGYTDTQSVKTFKRSSLKKILDETKSRGIVFEVELLFNALYYHLKVKEIPVDVRDMRESSSINYIVILKAFLALFVLKARLVLRGWGEILQRYM
ncbi:MAG: glycosyltransferase [Candidatus Altiarchaeota archaeon]